MDVLGWRNTRAQNVVDQVATSIWKVEHTPSVAQAVLRALSTESPRLRYRVGTPVNLIIALKGFLPE